VAKKIKFCIVCGSKEFQPYCPGLVRCNSCGLVVAEMIPTAAELDELYQRDYFFGMEYSDYKADRPALEKNFKRRIRSLKPYIKPDSFVVEVGSAYGYFLNLVKSISGKHVGFDVSREGVDYANKELGLNTTNEDFLDYKFTNSSVDLVAMWDVAEHLTRPDEYVKKAAKILKKDGCLTLTTGDIGKLVPRIKGAKWRMIHPPTHVYYFDAKTMTQLLEKHGFGVKSIKYKSIYRNTGSVINQLIYAKKALDKSTKLLETAKWIAEKTHLTRINVPLNTFDIMEVIAVKK
jgi:SAM-dependent methyltransferase